MRNMRAFLMLKSNRLSLGDARHFGVICMRVQMIDFSLFYHERSRSTLASKLTELALTKP